MPDLIGKTIGQYKIVEQIGVGGMATVFKAFQASINRYVAVKILPTQFANDPNFVKRFTQEAQAIAALEHPHILPVYDFGTAEGQTYMVMRYVEGGTLTNLMGQPLPNERIVDIVSSMARALDYAHSQGVVHRDIKPSNILIDKHGEALLTDFGIAKIMAGSGGTRLTSTGSILGTPEYMAPEQAEGISVDGRTDIYSLGVVLYELLTGQPPYRAETPLAVVLKHVNDPLPLPRTIKPDVAVPLERVVLKAMAKDRNQRYQSAGEMAQTLKDALKDVERAPGTADLPTPRPTGLAGPPPPTPAPAKSGRSMTGTLLIGGVIIAALLCFLVGGGLVIWGLATSSEEDGEIAGVTPTASQQVEPATVPETKPAELSEPTKTPTPPPPAENSSSQDTIIDIPELGEEILFEEGFDSNQHDWFVGLDEDEYGRSEADIVDGRYRMSQEATRNVAWWSSLDGVDFDDFVLSVEAMPVEQNAPFAYGIIFRNDFDEAFYSFEIDDEGYFVNLFIDGEWQTVVDYTETPAIASDGPNQLMVKAVGPVLSFFINGQEVITVEDDTLESGSIGLMFELYEAGDTAIIDFDNLIVEQADSGDEIIFAEYFDSDANGWATGVFEDDYTLDEISIRDGQYRLSVMAKQPAYVEKKLPTLEFSDFILILDATPIDAGEHYSYGVAFRENSSGHTYTFEIGNDGLYGILMFDGEWKNLKDWSSAPAIKVGQTNELMVIAEGSTLTFFVNGEDLTFLEDDTLSEGQIGLIVDMFEEDTSATVVFDNLVVESVGHSK